MQNTSIKYNFGKVDTQPMVGQKVRLFSRKVKKQKRKLIEDGYGKVKAKEFKFSKNGVYRPMSDEHASMILLIYRIPRNKYNSALDLAATAQEEHEFNRYTEMVEAWPELKNIPATNRLVP